MDLTHVQRVRLLYKTILHLHRGLPTELQVMGNSYARDEFKRHKSCNIAEASVFMVEWTKYAVTLAQQLGLKGPKYAKKLGENLDENKLDQMREDQLMQLYELLLAAKENHTESEDNKVS
ncbi:Succinate dehydrogenase assembly factor 3, mitochondrial [Cryptotermes secundus]|uniref:Succinate dehydrogenase assembly factor 3 n=1 Tax=Cryptotermes secundus TaxID=105785 RepID=A0A2J7RQ91_9NEOP|nr:Succinate dehydrogenase assembly factor 3, mitochondrial [Cryptotermes secundus]